MLTQYEVHIKLMLSLHLTIILLKNRQNTEGPSLRNPNMQVTLSHIRCIFFKKNEEVGLPASIQAIE
jgi:hypothetical protein